MLGAAALAIAAVGGLNVPKAEGSAGADDTGNPGNTALQALHISSAAGATEKTAGDQARQLRQRIEQDRVSRAQRRAELQRTKQRIARQKAAARAAREAARPKWVLPVLGYHLSAGFGESSALWSTMHTGQDFAAPEGTPVRSVGDGVVTGASWDGAYGNKLEVRHDDGTVTWYAHLSSYVVQSGRVKAGQVIARVGSTGNSTGPHLHLEVRPGGGEPVDPMPWLLAHGIHA